MDESIIMKKRRLVISSAWSSSPRPESPTGFSLFLGSPKVPKPDIFKKPKARPNIKPGGYPKGFFQGKIVKKTTKFWCKTWKILFVAVAALLCIYAILYADLHKRCMNINKPNLSSLLVWSLVEAIFSNTTQVLASSQLPLFATNPRMALTKWRPSNAWPFDDPIAEFSKAPEP